MHEADIGPMQELAISYHEMTKSFQAAGFSRKEALQFTLNHFQMTMENASRQNEENNED